jgi:formylglycine-generating enzyme required for sulfatase activity
VKRAVLFVDACRNNPQPGIKSGSQGFSDMNIGEGIQIFFSTRHGDVSYEHVDFQHGIFSHYLIQAFSNEQARENGILTFSSLSSYVERQVANWTEQNMSRTQQPYRRSAGDYFGEFVLAGSMVSVPPQPKSEPPPKQVEPVLVTRIESEPSIQPEVQIKHQRKSYEPEMIEIKSGTFMMGCIKGRDDIAGGCFGIEDNAHKVRLSDFSIGKYEITFSEWDYCEKAKACPHAEDEGWGRGRQPVINVSWQDIQRYINWLNKKTGKVYRLPTEAEWEYAARGGGNNAYPWGNQIDCDKANYGYENSQCFIDKPKEVGSYVSQANSYGLYDTVGNVLEWTSDYYAPYSSRTVINPKGASFGIYRVIKGGSWLSPSRKVRSSHRGFSSPSGRFKDLGFRLVLEN